METKDFQILKDRIEQELRIDENNVMDKSIQLSNLYSQFLKIYSKELRVLKNKLLEKDKVYGELYHWYKFNISNQNGAKFEYTLDSKTEIDIYVKADPKYYQIALEYAQLEVQVNFLEQTLTHINNLGFRIKNYIDLLKMKKGIL